MHLVPNGAPLHKNPRHTTHRLSHETAVLCNGIAQVHRHGANKRRQGCCPTNRQTSPPPEARGSRGRSREVSTSKQEHNISATDYVCQAQQMSQPLMHAVCVRRHSLEHGMSGVRTSRVGTREKKTLAHTNSHRIQNTFREESGNLA